MLKRQHVLDKKDKKFLEYCSDHTTIKQKFDIPFIDSKNVKQSFQCTLNVPLDVKGSQRVRHRDDIVDSNYIRPVRMRKKTNTTNTVEKSIGLAKECDAYGCTHRYNEENIYFKSVPARPATLNITRTNLRDIDRIRYYCRVEHRRRILINFGLHPNDDRKDIRFCCHHKITKND